MCGKRRYMEAAHVKDFLCALRIGDNAGDELAWFRLLQLLDGVGPVIARRALSDATWRPPTGRSRQHYSSGA